MPSPMRVGDRGGGGQRDQRVEAALVVVEAHAADEGGRRVLLHGEVGVLGQVERVEAELFDRAGQHGRGQVAVGQGGGDAEAHGQDPAGGRAANSARVPLPDGARRAARAKAACSRRLASTTASRRAARTRERAGPGGGPGVGRDARGQGDRLVEDGAGVAHLEGQPELDQLGRLTQSEVRRTRAACCHPMSGGEEDAAGRLGRHAQLGERARAGAPRRRPGRGCSGGAA